MSENKSPFGIEDARALLGVFLEANPQLDPLLLGGTQGCLRALVAAWALLLQRKRPVVCPECRGHGAVAVTHCTRGGTDIGVGVMHEPGCGSEECACAHKGTPGIVWEEVKP